MPQSGRDHGKANPIAQDGAGHDVAQDGLRSAQHSEGHHERQAQQSTKRSAQCASLENRVGKHGLATRWTTCTVEQRSCNAALHADKVHVFMLPVPYHTQPQNRSGRASSAAVSHPRPSHVTLRRASAEANAMAWVTCLRRLQASPLWPSSRRGARRRRRLLWRRHPPPWPEQRRLESAWP